MQETIIIEFIIFLIVIFGFWTVAFVLADMIMPDLEPSMSVRGPETRGYEPVKDDFRDKTTEIFNEAKNNHPELKDVDIELKVESHISGPAGTVTYGVHIPFLGHRVEISQSAHVTDDKLFNTVCHELAHVLDHERRGNSCHDIYFDKCQEEIEERIEKEKLV